jgi:hypothetical protein
MADQYPSATVTGTDLSPIQPEWVPPNCHFEIDDVSLEWTFPPDHFDFIHIREPAGLHTHEAGRLGRNRRTLCPTDCRRR